MEDFHLATHGEKKEKMYVLELKFQIGSSRKKKMNIKFCTCVAFDLCYGNDKDQFLES